MASLLDLAQARLGGLLAPQRPSMAGLLGGQRTQGNIASVLQGYTPPQMTALTNPQVMDYARNVAQSAQQNLQTQMSDLDKAIVMGQQGIQVGDREALARLMEQVPGLMGATAYHGTPHTIRGKFDISKVGTGEGNQSYGYGMYFAENPAVAKQYRDNLSDFDWAFGGKPYDINNPAHRAAIELKQLGGNSALADTIKRYEKNIADLESRNADWAKSAAQKKKEELAVLKTGVLPQLEETSKGNLYKVDIPDKDIPNMLDWDKPISKQSELVQNVAKDLLPKIKQVSPDVDINKMTGKDFYRAYQRYRGNYPDFASEGLNELGIKGIRYLDEGSRVDFKYSGDPAYIHAGNSFKESGYTLKEAIEGMKKAYKNANPEELELAMNDVYGIQPKKTSNFVVFEPSTVKILEKNSQKVEGLLD